MSFNQSRSDKGDSQSRKSGRSAGFNQQRTSSGAYGKGAGGGPAPSPSLLSSSSLHSNRSFKKTNNAQGGPSRVNSSAVNASEASHVPAPRNIQNGAHEQPHVQGASDAPVASSASKPVESSTTQRSTRAVPKAPTSQSASMSSENTATTAAAKVAGDASKGYNFQFGSLTVDGMQIPARTSSAPPNLDEQKRDQARHDSHFRPGPNLGPNLPIPVPKEQIPTKDTDQTNTAEAHPVAKVKKDVQASPATPVNQTHKPSVLAHPLPMTSMPMPFTSPQVPVQFGTPNTPIAPQSVAATSLQMQMHVPLTMGNAAQVQQPVFLPGLQHHPMAHQGIMHQSQGLSFTPTMAGQLAPQLGNVGLGITPQYPQQQGGKFGGPRKTTPVKITHPDTHEELRLDKRGDTYSDSGSGPRTHPSVPSQAQQISPFGHPHPINFYSNSFSANPIYYPSQSSTPNAQGPRFNYPISQGPQNVAFKGSAAVHINKPVHPIHSASEPLSTDHARDAHVTSSSIPSGTAQVTLRPATVSVDEKVADSSLSGGSRVVEKVGSPKPPRPSAEASVSHPQKDLDTCSESSQVPKVSSEPWASKSLPAAVKHSVPVPTTVSNESLASIPFSSMSVSASETSTTTAVSNESRRREPLSRSNSIKEHQKKPGKKGHIQPQNQIDQSTLTSNVAACASEHSASSESVPEVAEAKASGTSSATGEVLSETTGELVSKDALSSVSLELKSETNVGGAVSVSSEVSGASFAVEAVDTAQHAEAESPFLQDRQTKPESSDMEGHGENALSQKHVQGNAHFEIPLQSKQESPLKATANGSEVPSSGIEQEGLNECMRGHVESEGGDIDVVTSKSSDFADAAGSHCDVSVAVDLTSSATGSTEANEKSPGILDQQSLPVPTADIPESALRYEWEGAPVSGSKERPVLEQSRAKSTATRGKKKRKEILQKADAAGTTSDLYMAYKGPEEKIETVMLSESAESSFTSIGMKQAALTSPDVDAVENEKIVQNKAEPDDWEDAADISTPKLETSADGEQAHGLYMDHEKDGDGNLAKKYSRDFLLKFADQCTDLPQGFEIASDIAGVLMSPNVNSSQIVDRDSYPSPGRIIDRQSSGSRLDRRGSGIMDDDRWSKLPGPFGPGRDLRVDVSYGGSANFRPGQGVNYGVLRHPRAQATVAYTGGILAGPMQSMGPQGGMPRNSPDAERWQRAASFQQKGLFPSPNTPLQVMHKADKKYEVGKITDEEEAKQRQLKAILNKLTPQNFDKLFEQVKAVNIDNAGTLSDVISQIFHKALMEPTFCEMYANFCYHLAGALPDFSEDNEKITFKRLLLNKCQEEFERGEREEEEASKADGGGEAKQTEEEREEKRVKARRRMLGNIRLIGELYKKRMLTERIMHDCIKKLLGQYQNPDEEDVEALCKLMSTIGEMIDHPKAKEHMDAYFDMMAKLSNNMKLSSRVRFMLKDSIDLRKNKWQQRRKVEGPKKIEEVHRDAAQERQAQASRLARGPNVNSSSRRTPTDFGPRGSSMLSSPGGQMGNFRGLPAQVRAFGAQDVRLEDRQSFEARSLSVPLPQRPIGDDSITLGPQGGLGRGMSYRGAPVMSNTPLSDVSPASGESRRLPTGLNGFSSVPERTNYGSREDFVQRYVPDRFTGGAAYDQSGSQERNMNYSNRDLRNQDRSFDKPLVASPSVRGQTPGLAQNIPQEKVWPEERLRDMSLSAIKEYYSARDEKEVALCIKDLNSPSFHPSMIALWVTDSFERKDMERDLLARLLVNLSKSRDSVLSQVQLIKGFESVLSTLEDAVNDAPRAPEFLGLIFSKVIVENVVPLREIGRLIREGGEEPGCLLKFGRAGDVLGNTLEMIQREKGQTVLSDILAGSSLRLEDFRPPDPNRSKMLEKFI